MSLLIVTGKCFSETGLHDLIVEAEIMSDGVIGSVVEGKQYNRAIRAHKVVAEAVSHLLSHEFESWARFPRRISMSQPQYGEVVLK